MEQIRVNALVIALRQCIKYHKPPARYRKVLHYVNSRDPWAVREAAQKWLGQVGNFLYFMSGRVN